MTLRRRAGAAVVGIALAAVLPAVALAHPLGNFTVNHFAGIRVEPERILLDVVVDQAEIPTFQEKLRIDTDGDGSVSDAEAEAERVVACPALAPSLSLSVAGTPLTLRAVEAGLSFPPGTAGMETMRVVCVYLAELRGPLAPGSAIAFTDTSGAGRIGWREITAVGSGVTLAPGSPPVSSVSARLTAYPAALIPKPLDIRSASFEVSLGGPVLAPFSVPDAAMLPGAESLEPSVGDGADPVAAGPATTSGAAGGAGAGIRTTTAATPRGAVPGGVGSEISGLLEQRDLTPVVLVGAFLAAMALGAGHALTPGHGKTLMGAYLVGTRGTPVHAVALGLSVTVSHTLGILVLAAVVIGLRGVVSPELYNRVAPVVSGLLVLGIGAWLLVGQVAKRRRRARAVAHDHEEGLETDHLPHVHDHGGARHGHLSPAEAGVGWRGLFVLGLAGGVIPSTNALIILLSTIATGRAAYGLVLVVAFGLGMAVVLGGVGLGLVLARDRVDDLPARSSLGRLAGYAPIVAGVVVLGLGVWLTSQAVGVAPTL